MNDIQVDVFSTDESTGPFVFGSYLSWLWYDFSLGIGQARIHYCARCGKGFSTAGHRGIEKRYCSDRCREAAHNERTAQSKAWARRLFLQKEMSIDAIRKRLFAHEQKPPAVSESKSGFQVGPISNMHSTRTFNPRDGAHLSLPAAEKRNSTSINC